MCDSPDSTSTQGARLETAKRDQHGPEDRGLLSSQSGGHGSLSLSKQSYQHDSDNGNDIIKDSSHPGNHLFEPSRRQCTSHQRPDKQAERLNIEQYTQPEKSTQHTVNMATLFPLRYLLFIYCTLHLHYQTATPCLFALFNVNSYVHYYF